MNHTNNEVTHQTNLTTMGLMTRPPNRQCNRTYVELNSPTLYPMAHHQLTQDTISAPADCVNQLNTIDLGTKIHLLKQHREITYTQRVHTGTVVHRRQVERLRPRTRTSVGA